MSTQISGGKRVVLVALAAVLALPGPLFAREGGGFHGGFHGDFHGHPGYGRPFYRPYYHPYFHNRLFFGLALGTFVATLPLYYDTFYYGGVPYYYYGDTYYEWNDAQDQYQVVAPPPGAPTTSSSQALNELFAYPTKGQSPDEQKTDRYRCHAWAVGQTGFDPTAGVAGSDTQRDDYFRAEGACLEGRGYAVQ